MKFLTNLILKTLVKNPNTLHVVNYKNKVYFVHVEEFVPLEKEIKNFKERIQI